MTFIDFILHKHRFTPKTSLASYVHLIGHTVLLTLFFHGAIFFLLSLPLPKSIGIFIVLLLGYLILWFGIGVWISAAQFSRLRDEELTGTTPLSGPRFVLAVVTIFLVEEATRRIFSLLSGSF